jgi:hypothetical protein
MHGLFIRGLLEWITIFTFFVLIHYLCFSGRSCLNKIFAFSTCLWFVSFIVLFWFVHHVCFCCSSFVFFLQRLFVFVVHPLLCFSYVCLFLLFIFCFVFPTFVWGEANRSMVNWKGNRWNQLLQNFSLCFVIRDFWGEIEIKRVFCYLRCLRTNLKQTQSKGRDELFV